MTLWLRLSQIWNGNPSRNLLNPPRPAPVSYQRTADPMLKPGVVDMLPDYGRPVDLRPQQGAVFAPPVAVDYLRSPDSDVAFLPVNRT